MAKTQSEIKVAFFDIDGTLYRDNFSLRLIEVLREKNQIDARHCLDLDAIISAWREREASYDDVNAELSKVTETALEGLYLDDLMAAGSIAAELGKRRPYVFTKALFESLKAQRRRPRLVAISGSPIAVVEPYCMELGFDEVHATYFELDDGRVTGGFSKAASPYHHKDQVCHEVADRLRLKAEHGIIMGAIAVGDAVADHRMLGVVEYPIAFNPTHGLLELCRAHSTPVVIERKNVVQAMLAPWAKKDAGLHEVAIESILPNRLAKRVRERIPNLYQPT